MGSCGLLCDTDADLNVCSRSAAGCRKVAARAGRIALGFLWWLAVSCMLLKLRLVRIWRNLGSANRWWNAACAGETILAFLGFLWQVVIFLLPAVELAYTLLKPRLVSIWRNLSSASQWRKAVCAGKTALGFLWLAVLFTQPALVSACMLLKPRLVSIWQNLGSANHSGPPPANPLPVAQRPLRPAAQQPTGPKGPSRAKSISPTRGMRKGPPEPCSSSSSSSNNSNDNKGFSW